MINAKLLCQAALKNEPFRYAVINQCLTDDTINRLIQELPQEDYFRSLRENGSDKTYNVINNVLLKLGDNSPSMHLPRCWQDFIQHLQSNDYIDPLSTLLREDLSSCRQEITLKRYGYGDFISPHTDREDVTATHLFFLNHDWDPAWGGGLLFLYNENEPFQKFLPTSKHSIAFVRSENSWHSVEKITHVDAERIAVQVAFWNRVERQVLAGRIETTVQY